MLAPRRRLTCHFVPFAEADKMPITTEEHFPSRAGKTETLAMKEKLQVEKERKRVHYTTLKAEATPYGKTLPMSEGLVKVIGLGAHRLRVRVRVRGRVRVRRASSRS